MPETVQVVVDATGDLHVELSGYRDATCEAEEARLRAALAELGLGTAVTARRRKSPAEIAAETRRPAPEAGRRVTR